MRQHHGNNGSTHLVAFVPVGRVDRGCVVEPWRQKHQRKSAARFTMDACRTCKDTNLRSD